MRYIVIALLIFKSVNSHANCELISNGFHTMATYRDKSTFNTLPYPIDYHYYNKSIEFKLSQLDKPIDRSPIKKINLVGEICDVKNIKLEFPMKATEALINVSSCLTEPQSNRGKKLLYSPKDEMIFLPKEVQLIEPDLAHKSKLEKIENGIREFLKDKFYRGIEYFTLSPGDYEIKDIKNYWYKDTSAFMSIVSAESTQKNKELKIRFQIVFMSVAEEVWYIADSAYENPCDHFVYEVQPEEIVPVPSKIPVNEKNISELTQNEIRNISESNIELFKTGWVYGDSIYPQIIEFDADKRKSKYFIEFQKRMIVLTEDGYRHRMHNNPTLGVQTQNQIQGKKESAK